jgi:uncharacterized membrane protein YgcG
MSRTENDNVTVKTLTIIAVLIFIFGIVPAIFNSLTMNQKDETTAADGFRIESFDIHMKVTEDNRVKVEETIVTDWYEHGHHGIYRTVPYWLEYTNKDNKTNKKKARISNFKSTERYETSEENGRAKIKIGDPYQTLPTGYHTYNISYVYDMGEDIYKGFDEFIFHAFGDHWGTEINNASLTIEMPDEIDERDITFFADKYRQEDITKHVDYHVEGNTLYAKLDGDYRIFKSLTVDIELEDGYFKGGAEVYGKKSLNISLIIIMITVILFICWLIYGKDFPKGTQTVEFYPPDNLDPSQIGYIYGKTANNELVAALLVSLAKKGYIKICDEGTVINQKPKDGTEVKTIYIEKGKDFGVKTILSKEALDYLETITFVDGKATICQDLENFEHYRKALVAQGQIKVVKEETNKVEDTKELEELTTNEKILYDKLFENSDVNVISEDTTLYTVFGDLTNNLKKELKDKLDDKIAHTMTILSRIVIILCLVFWYFSFNIFQDLDPRFQFLYLISMVCIFISFFFSTIMERKTTYGELMTARVNGFRNYIETAEKNQIEALVEKNPNYFLDILPYAYILKVSKKWVEKFENIPLPDTTYMGNIDYTDIDFIKDLGSSISIPSSSGSSGGCGSGCSSCGGGCSSCGGGGSW